MLTVSWDSYSSCFDHQTQICKCCASPTVYIHINLKITKPLPLLSLPRFPLVQAARNPIYSKTFFSKTSKIQPIRIPHHSLPGYSVAHNYPSPFCSLVFSGEVPPHLPGPLKGYAATRRCGHKTMLRLPRILHP